MDINGTLKGIHTDSKSNMENTTEYECVEIVKEIVDRNRFPNDFEAWTVNKQYSWINKNIAQLFPNVPESLLDFILAAYHPLVCDRSPQELPQWMDMDKYRRGQKFVNEHYAAVIMCKILGLIYAYSYEDSLKAFIMGGHSHTLYLGFKRYLSTVRRISNWYNGEPWIKGTQAYKDMQVTRSVHSALRQKLCQLNNEQIDAATTFANPWCPNRELLLEDFAAACPFEKIGQRPYTMLHKSPHRPKGINNADLAGIQSGFVGLFLLHQQNVGAHDATDEDLEAFCHMWRCYGYFLGMEDEYNFCRGSLEEVKQRTRDFYQYWAIPNLKDVTPEWEHVTRCMVEPLNYYPILYMPYKAVLLTATDAMNLNMPHLYASLNYTEWIIYKGLKFFLRHVSRFSGGRALLNKVMRKIVNDAMNFGPEKLAEIHEKLNKQLPDFSIVY